MLGQGFYAISLRKPAAFRGRDVGLAGQGHPVEGEAGAPSQASPQASRSEN